MAAITVTAGNVVAGSNSVTKNVTAGETITAGMSVYKDAATGYYKKASTASAAAAAIEGISLNGASLGQPLQIQTSGNINPGGTVTVGEIYCASDTAGGIGPEGDNTTGDYVTVIGIGTTTSNISMNIHQGGVAIP